MTRTTPDLGDTIAGSIFDHVERERALLRHDIARIINDGMTLHGAKNGGTLPMSPEYQAVFNATAELCRLLLTDLSLAGSVPQPVIDKCDKIYRALRATGWKP
jgi:hypothetical protein